jgi:large subunit ribosomal protein L10
LAITKEKKEKLIQTYVELLENSQAIVFVYSSGLTVAEVTRLRTRIREAGSNYHIVKNSLFERALGQLGMPVPPDLAGPTAVVFCSESIATVVKSVEDFAKELGEREFQITGGIIENQVLRADAAKSLSSLPSKEQLFAQILAGFNAPAGKLTGTIANGVRQILNVLQARVDQLTDSSEA